MGLLGRAPANAAAGFEGEAIINSLGDTVELQIEIVGKKVKAKYALKEPASSPRKLLRG